MADLVAESEMLLDGMDTSSFESEEDAAAALAEAALSVNQAIASSSSDLSAQGFIGGIGDKLRKIIKKLVAFVKKVATEWGAISYSVGVSLTGVSVSVEWAGPKA